MRAYFKNDNYFFSVPLLKSSVPEKVLEKKEEQKQKKGQEIAQLEVNLGIEIKEQTQKSQKEKEEMKDMLKSFSKKKKKPEGDVSKNIFLPEKMKKANLVVKEPVKDESADEMEKRQQIINRNREYKKMEENLKKEANLINETTKKQEEEKTKPKQQEEGKKVTNQFQEHQNSQTKKGIDEKGDENDEEESEEISEGQGQKNGKENEKKDSNKGQKQKKNKTKRIKKEKNYVRLDLKRKYKDRFIGGINANLRRYTKNGRLKPQYRKTQNQVIIQEGELYNSYVSCLSKALCMTINLEDSDEDEDKEISEPIVEPPTPSSYSREDLQAYLRAAFGFQDFREGQFQTISNIIEGTSTIFISETASGKSLAYIMSSMVLGGLSMVVSPLVSLILDQLDHLPPFLPAACISSLINRQQRDRIISLVKSNQIKLLFVTPQSLQTDFIYHLQDFPPMNFVCVDEAHSLSELSHNFRTSFLGLGEILLKHVKYRLGYPTILALTATANPQTVVSIKDRLNIENVIRSESCMNKNLFVTVSRQRGTQKFDSLITYLEQPQISKCRGILIYTRTRKIMFEVFNYVTNSTTLNTAIYHSALTSKEKTDILTGFREERIRVVVATIALGMGLDFSHLQCVIHINMPKSIENYVQEIGRAGRRERRAYCHLFLDDNDYITQRNYIIADELEPIHLIALYEKLKQHSRKLEKDKAKGQPVPTKQQQADLVVRRAALMIEHAGFNEIIEEQEIEEDQEEQDPTKTMGDCLRSQLYSIRIDRLTSATKLRQQALLTLLLKIEALMKNWDVRLRVLPTSHQMLKVSFFKKNEQQLTKDSDFFRQLALGCRRAKGIIYIPLIQKCNKMGLRPIQLLTNIYRLGNTYTLKIELQFPVYVWQFQGKRKFTEEDPIQQLIARAFEKLSSGEEVQFVLQQINRVQNTSMVKLNTLYTVGFFHSRNNINAIVKNNCLISRSAPIPSDSIVKKFDEYFRSGLSDFYRSITNNEEDICIPTSIIQEAQKVDIYESIKMFFKNEVNLDEVYNEFERDELRRKAFEKYDDGKVITKILMGVNYGEVTWKIYGERQYWMLFKSKNYPELLEAVKEQLNRYKAAYQIRD